MKILFMIPSLTGGGAERVVSQLANQLTQNGNTIEIGLFLSDEVTYQIDKNIILYSFKDTRLHKHFRYIRRLHKLRSILKTSNPDIVVSFITGDNIATIIAASGLRCKVVLSERNNPYVEPALISLKILRKLLYCKADGFVFQTFDAMRFYSSRIQSRSIIISNPINPNLPDVFIGERTSRIVTTVRLEPQKNIKLAIDAFSDICFEFPEYSFEIYGKGSQEQEIMKYIEKLQLGEKVFLKGFSKNIYNDIKDAKLFVLSSNYEGMSNSLIEAMALGIPCISTDHPIGGARVVIKDGINGILVGTESRIQLSNAMRFVLKDQSIASRISNNAVKIRKDLDLKEISSEWERYFQSILNLR